MSINKIIPLALAGTVALVGVSGLAFAKGDDNEAAEKAALSSATISLKQAIEIAEKEIGGKAVESGVDDEDGKTFYYEIEVQAPDGTEKEVLIDMKTGKVAKIMAGEHNDDGKEDHDKK